MLRFVAIVNGEQLETLLLAAKAAGVTPELGVEPVTAERARRKSRGAKRSTKRKGKRAKSKASVRLVANSSLELTPKESKARDALLQAFGTDSFQRSLAKGVVAKRFKSPHVSGYITSLQRKGAIAYAG